MAYYSQYYLYVISMVMIIMSMVGHGYDINARVPCDDSSISFSSNYVNNTLNTTPDRNQEISMLEKHETWMIQYGRTYKDAVEKEKRFNIFKQNVDYIERFNRAGGHTYTLRVNRLADRTIDERRASYGSLQFPNTNSSGLYNKTTTSSFKSPKLFSTPAVDWVQRNAVTGVKNEGEECAGSSWAFAAAAAMEGLIYISKLDKPDQMQAPVDLSVQQLIDCVTKEAYPEVIVYGDGCTAGLAQEAFYWVAALNFGMAAQENYKYMGVKNDICEQLEENHDKEYTITGFEQLGENDMDGLFDAIDRQPVTLSLKINADEFAFLGPHDVFNGACDDPSNGPLYTTVTIVGYSVDEAERYVLIKNSRGTEWGNGGYAKLGMNQLEHGFCPGDPYGQPPYSYPLIGELPEV